MEVVLNRNAVRHVLVKDLQPGETAMYTIILGKEIPVLKLFTGGVVAFNPGSRTPELWERTEGTMVRKLFNGEKVTITLP